MKKRVAILSLFVICILMTGCASVSYKVYQPDTNTIVQSLEVTLDGDVIEGAGLTVASVKSDISSYVNSVVASILTTYETNVIDVLMANHITINAKSLFVNAVDVNGEWSGSSYFLDVVYVGIDDTAYNISIPVSNIYNLFNYGELVVESSGESTVVEEQGLLIKSSQTTITTLGSQFANSVVERFVNKYSVNGFDEDDVVYTYTLGSEYKRLHSDSDMITYVDGIYMHTWNLDSRADEIEIFRLYANQYLWYIIGLGTAFVFGVSLFVISRTFLKKNKN